MSETAEKVENRPISLLIDDVDPDKGVVLATDMQAAVYMSWLYMRYGQEQAKVQPPVGSGLPAVTRKGLRAIVESETGPDGLKPNWNQVQNWRIRPSIKQALAETRQEEWEIGREMVAGSWVGIVEAQIEAAIHGPLDKRWQAARFCHDLLRTPEAPNAAKMLGGLAELTKRYGGGVIRLTRVTETAEYDEHTLRESTSDDQDDPQNDAESL